MCVPTGVPGKPRLLLSRMCKVLMDRFGDFDEVVKTPKIAMLEANMSSNLYKQVKIRPDFVCRYS